MKRNYIGNYDMKNEHDFNFACPTCKKQFYVLDKHCPNCRAPNKNLLYLYLTENKKLQWLRLLPIAILSIPGIPLFLIFFFAYLSVYGAGMAAVYVAITLVQNGIFFHEPSKDTRDLYLITQSIGVDNYYLSTIVLVILAIIGGVTVVGVFGGVFFGINKILSKTLQVKEDGDWDYKREWLSFILIPFNHALYRFKYAQHIKLYNTAKFAMGLKIVDKLEDGERGNINLNSDFLLQVYGELKHGIEDRVTELQTALNRLGRIRWWVYENNVSCLGKCEILELLEIVGFYERRYVERKFKGDMKQLIEGLQDGQNIQENPEWIFLQVPPWDIAETYHFTESTEYYTWSIWIMLICWYLKFSPAW